MNITFSIYLYITILKFSSRHSPFSNDYFFCARETHYKLLKLHIHIQNTLKCSWAPMLPGVPIHNFLKQISDQVFHVFVFICKLPSTS